jgi:hypothetical protein
MQKQQLIPQSARSVGFFDTLTVYISELAGNKAFFEIKYTLPILAKSLV